MKVQLDTFEVSVAARHGVPEIDRRAKHAEVKAHLTDVVETEISAMAERGEARGKAETLKEMEAQLARVNELREQLGKEPLEMEDLE